MKYWAGEERVGKREIVNEEGMNSVWNYESFAGIAVLVVQFC